MFGDEDVAEEGAEEGSRRAFNDNAVSAPMHGIASNSCCSAVALQPLLLTSYFHTLQALTRREQALQLATKCFRKGYPYLGAASQLWLLSYNVAYLFDRTPYWRPWLQAMRVDIRRVGAEDYVSLSAALISH